MAAGLYLLLMWGYVVLQIPQLFAAFAALIMSIALLFWVSEARVRESKASASETGLDAKAEVVEPIYSSEPSISASNMRLDSLKADLMEQYAQFGRDQSSLNSKGLGTWHQNRGNREGDQS